MKNLRRLLQPAFALIVALGCLLAPAGRSLAVQPDEILKDPKLEARARAISAELRCVVCQNQSIDDSNAGLARDLRLLVRERLQKGDSDSQVMDYLVQRYGEFVLLKPTFSLHNLLLWLTPLVGLIGGGILALRYMRDNAVVGSGASELTPEEQAEVDRLLKE